jgi:predicted membrane channel-forming protein YqfA (hemolysin III family)
MGNNMTSHILMLIFFIFMGLFVFSLPLMTTIPEQKETLVSAFQIGVLICTILSALNAFDDLKKLLKNNWF